MKNYSLKKLLLEMKKNYVEQPLFLVTESGKGLRPVMYQDFLADLCAGISDAEKIEAARIAIVGHNSYEWFITAMALLISGKTLILMNPDLGDDDLLYLLDYTDAECVLLSGELKQEYGFLEKQFQIKKFFESEGKNVEEAEKVLSRLPDRKGEFLCFTSGTSKSSKGAVIQTETLSRHVLLVKEEGVLSFRRGDRIFIPLPLYHIYGLTFLFHTMAAGATVCLCTSARRLIQEAELMNPHVALLVPSMIEPLFRKSGLMPELRLVISGGGVCRSEQAELVRRRGVCLLNGYGSSESIALVMLSLPGENEQWMKPLDCVECEISGNGELWIRSPYHLEKYYKRPKETEEVLDGDVIRTGDSARMNEQGSVQILGRLRDTIVMENGEKIHAEDMDDILVSMRGVLDAAVVYSPEYGISAVVVPALMEQVEIIRNEVEQYNRNAGILLRFRHIWYRKEKLPRTTTGKLRRYQLEEEYKSWREGKK